MYPGLEYRAIDDIRRMREVDVWAEKSFFVPNPDPRSDTERGLNIARAIATDSDFVKRLNAIDVKDRIDDLHAYIYMESFAGPNNRVSLMTLDVCAYSLKKKFGIDFGKGDMRFFEQAVKEYGLYHKL